VRKLKALKLQEITILKMNFTGNYVTSGYLLLMISTSIGYLLYHTFSSPLGSIDRKHATSLMAIANDRFVLLPSKICEVLMF
jgi:hypothetical protein